MKNQIAVPKDFFKKERKNLYSNWALAFWREMFQNSLDAKATSVFIEMDESDGKIHLAFTDNGCGMDRETLEDVFFCLGATTKENENNSVGGFGRARILTCFAMDHYSIATGNLHVSGDGAYYEIFENTDNQRGTKFDIWIDDSTIDEMKDELDNLINYSQMTCGVYYNGSKMKPGAYRNRFTKELSFGNIYLNKSKPSYGRILVRVNGLHMFSMYTSYSKQVIVEIDPKSSRSILNANRDHFQYPYDEELQSFVRELSVDTLSALRPVRNKSAIFSTGKGNNRLIIPGKANLLTDNDHSMDDAESSGGKYDATMGSTYTDRSVSSSHNAPRHINDWKNRILSNVVVRDETCGFDTEIRNVIDHYNPRNWYITRENGKTKFQGVNRLKLLLAWEAACAEALKAFAISQSENSFHALSLDWTVGWIFSTEINACYLRSEVDRSTTHAFLLNPLSRSKSEIKNCSRADNPGSMKYSITNKQDWRALASRAAHEVTHVLYSQHDEQYARLLTEINAIMDYRAMEQNIKNSIDTVRNLNRHG